VGEDKSPEKEEGGKKKQNLLYPWEGKEGQTSSPSVGEKRVFCGGEMDSSSEKEVLSSDNGQHIFIAVIDSFLAWGEPRPLWWGR